MKFDKKLFEQVGNIFKELEFDSNQWVIYDNQPFITFVLLR